MLSYLLEKQAKSTTGTNLKESLTNAVLRDELVGSIWMIFLGYIKLTYEEKVCFLPMHILVLNT